MCAAAKSVVRALRRTVLGTAPSFDGAIARCSWSAAPAARATRYSAGAASPTTHHQLTQSINSSASAVLQNRGGRAVWLSPLCCCSPAYAVSSMLILQPTFLDEQLSAEFHVDEQVLAAVSMAFFGCWGIGTFFITLFADR